MRNENASIANLADELGVMMADKNALVIDAQGVCSAVRQVPSPNCDVRPEGIAPDMVVIHNIHLPPGEPGTTAFAGDAIERLFTNCLDIEAHECFAELSTLRVSAHFLVRRDGEILQFVPCNLRAWHAGASRWQGRERCNDFSIGIELEGSDFVPFEDIQYERLNLLLNALQARYSIAHLVGHNEIAPGRKTDPGPFFVWEKLAPTVLELRQTGYIS